MSYYISLRKHDGDIGIIMGIERGDLRQKYQCCLSLIHVFLKMISDKSKPSRKWVKRYTTKPWVFEGVCRFAMRKKGLVGQWYGLVPLKKRGVFKVSCRVFRAERTCLAFEVSWPCLAVRCGTTKLLMSICIQSEFQWFVVPTLYCNQWNLQLETATFSSLPCYSMLLR